MDREFLMLVAYAAAGLVLIKGLLWIWALAVSGVGRVRALLAGKRS